MRYQANFKATNAITNGNPQFFDEGPGFIQLKAPAGSVLSSSRFRYVVIDGSKGEVPSSITLNPGGAGENVVDLFLPNNVPIAAGDKVEVAAYEVRNPTSANSGASVSLSTSSDVTNVSSSLAIGSASAVSELSASADSTSAGATDVRYQANFKATNAITNGNPQFFDEGPGFIQLKAPAGSVLSSSRFRYAVIDGSNGGVPQSVTLNPGGAGENVVDLLVPANVPIAAGDKVEVLAFEAKNPTSANSGASFSLSTSSDVTEVSKPLAIGSASTVSELSASADSTSAGATDVRYQASFKATNAITNGNPQFFDEGPGFIQLKAPAGVVFSSSRNLYAVVDGANAAAPASVTVNPSGAGENVVDVFEPNGFWVGARVRFKVEVQAYGVKNPTSANSGASVSLSTSSDVTEVSKPLAIRAASAVSEVRVGANSTSAGAADVHYQASFRATSAISNGNPEFFDEAPGFIQLKAPAGVVFSSNRGFYTVVDGASASGPISVTVNPNGAGENMVDAFLPNAFSVAAGDKVELQAYGVKNPSAKNPSAKFALSTSSDITEVTGPLPIGASTGGTANWPRGCSTEPIPSSSSRPRESRQAIRSSSAKAQAS